ncbi:MAG: hypothetical protein FWG94_05530 [Oscillospiraceae bacterium]|nr:hypothetical protein [Oscillospiraceae bacterium]
MQEQQLVDSKKVERIISGYHVTIIYSKSVSYDAIERVQKILMGSAAEENLTKIQNSKEGVPL